MADVGTFEVKFFGATINQVSLNLLVHVGQVTPFLQIVSPIGGEGGTGFYLTIGRLGSAV